MEPAVPAPAAAPVTAAPGMPAAEVTLADLMGEADDQAEMGAIRRLRRRLGMVQE